MTVFPTNTDSRIDTPNRRQVLLSTGTFLAGGGIAVALGSQPTKAAVTANTIEIPPETVEGRNTSVSSAVLSVGGNYEYQVNNADTLVLSLGVAPEGSQDYETIDSVEEPAGAAAGAGQYELSGSLTDHPALDYGTFSADTAETVNLSLPVRVVLDVRQGGESVTTAVAQGTAEIQVSNTGVEASAAVVGSGEVEIAV